MRIPLFQVDAFTSRPFAGNPAAICPLPNWLDDDTLRKVAAENNLSETAYFVPREGSYELRWFTPRCEVELCGHATLASAYVLLNILRPELPEVRFETRFSGALTVRREQARFAMDFPAMRPEACPNPPAALAHGLGPSAAPLNIMEANRNYVVVYETRSSVRNLRPDIETLEQLHPFGVIVTAPDDTGPDNEVDFVSRYFAPSYGVPEDPVTGAAHCALAPYWAKRLQKTSLHALQVSERGGEIWCEIAGDRVILKGDAVLTMQGTLHI
jgi:PhzF family phenazine biosynthesis protein